CCNEMSCTSGRSRRGTAGLSANRGIRCASGRELWGARYFYGCNKPEFGQRNATSSTEGARSAKRRRIKHQQWRFLPGPLNTKLELLSSHGLAPSECPRAGHSPTQPPL